MADYYQLPSGQIVPASQVQQSQETGQWYYLANPTSPEGGWVAVADGMPTPTDSATPAPTPLARQLGMNSVQYDRLRGLGLADEDIGNRLQAYMQRTGAQQADPMNWGDEAMNRVMGLPSDPAREAAQQKYIAVTQQKNQALNGQTDYGYLPMAAGIALGGTVAPLLAGSLGGGALGSLGANAAVSGLTSSLFGGDPITAAGRSLLTGGLRMASGGLGNIFSGNGGGAAQLTGSAGGGGMDYGGGYEYDDSGFASGFQGGTGNDGWSYGGTGAGDVLRAIGTGAGTSLLGNLLGGGGSGPSLLGSILGPSIGGLLGMSASNSAADTQAGAARDAAQASLTASREGNALLASMYQQNRADQEPWRAAGANALASLTGQLPGLNKPFALDDFNADPGYQFRLSEGEKGLNRAAGARGMYDSGATLKALTRYNQDYATGEFGNAYNRYNADRTNIFNRLAAISGTGQTAASNMGSAAQNFGANANANTMAGVNASNNALLGGANARASGYVGGANALAGAIGQGYNNYANQQLMGLLGGGR